jgi:mannitol/fructose-specific phosphotransferase system IIA component (Ntr-type)
MARPDEELVLDQKASFVRDFEPLVWNGADAESEHVPVHTLRNFDQ